MENNRNARVGDRVGFVKCFDGSPTPKQLFKRIRDWMYPQERMQEYKPKRRFNRNDGPMVFLGEQIVAEMQKAGYPAVIHESYRSPERQQTLKLQGRSRAGPWESPHQYYEAVDIVHKSKFWNVSEKFWETLAVCVRNVSKRYNVALEHGHYWRFRDSAHIEIATWRDVRNRQLQLIRENHVPTPKELAFRFEELLPNEKQPVTPIDNDETIARLEQIERGNR